MSADPRPQYRSWDPLAHLPAGMVLTREREQALMAAYIAGGRQPMSDAAIQAVLGAPLPYPATIRREREDGRVKDYA
jgi:hypothetical protein